MTDTEQIALLNIKVAHLEQHIQQLNVIIAQWEMLCKQQLAKQEEWNARLLGIGGGGQAHE